LKKILVVMPLAVKRPAVAPTFMFEVLPVVRSETVATVRRVSRMQDCVW